VFHSLAQEKFFLTAHCTWNHTFIMGAGVWRRPSGLRWNKGYHFWV